MRDEDGFEGVGEASPLPPFTRDGLSDVVRDLEGLPPTIAIDLSLFVDRLREGLPSPLTDRALSPTSRHALETALVTLLAAREGRSLTDWLSSTLGVPTPTTSSIEVRRLVDTMDERALATIDTLRARGVRHFKWKIGRSGLLDEDLSFVGAVLDLSKDLSLRLDANELLSPGDVARLVEMLTARGALDRVDVEDLVPFDALEACLDVLDGKLSYSIDAPLRDHREALFAIVDRRRAAGRRDAVSAVIKPAVFGALGELVSLLREARTRRIDVCFSHLFESPIALSATHAWARVFGTGPQGLSFYDGADRFTISEIGRPSLPLLWPRGWRDASHALSSHHDTSHGLGFTLPSPFDRVATSRRRAHSLFAVEQRRDDASSRSVDHTEADALTARLCRALDERGLETIAWVATPTLSSLFLLRAALESGRTLVPLHPRHTAHEHADVLRRTRAELVDASALVEPLLTSISSSGASSIDDEDSKERRSPSTLLFTSGTSGRAKAVLADESAWVAAAAMHTDAFGWDADDRWLIAMPLAHAGGISIVARSLLSKTAMVLVPDAFDATHVHRAIVEHRVTIVSWVPTMLARIVERGLEAPSHVRLVLLGGAACPTSLLRRGLELGWPLHTTYGLTEMCAQVVTRATPPLATALSTSVGEPLAGVSIRIEDGRVLVRSASAMKGYRHDDGTIDRPFDEDGFYDTGDLGHIDAHGELVIEARRTDLIVTGGENVYPVEVEHALGELEGIAAALVVGVPDATWGSRVAALVVTTPTFSAAPDDTTLLAMLGERLARYKLPRQLLRVDALPTNANGKPDRTRAVELILAAESAHAKRNA